MVVGWWRVYVGYAGNVSLLVLGKFWREGRGIKLLLFSLQPHYLYCGHGSGWGWRPLDRQPGAHGKASAVPRGMGMQVGCDSLMHPGSHVPLLEGMVLTCGTVCGCWALLQLSLDVP